MPLIAPNLDDLRFQRDLVDEARKRIIHYCPEWTEYNLSDPGITLIELFAWMTELMVYRLNKVPEKNYIKFMELLGMQLRPANSARTDLTFWLSVSLPISPENDSPVIVPVGTQVVSQSIGEEDIVFTTDSQLTIVPPKLTQLRRQEDFHKNYLPRLGIEDFYAFNRDEPQVGDTFYLGFDEAYPINGHILQIEFECQQVQAVGIKRDDPPWVWECAMGNDVWRELTPSTFADEKDTTGGLNNETGSITLYLPLHMKPDQLFGRTGYWVRCRLEPRRPEQGMYTESPRVIDVAAYTLGATVPATHAVVVENEFLGRSNGDPGQEFALEYSPLLDLRDDETVEVEENRYGDLVFVPWQRVPDFSKSSRYDRHFVLDTATGQIMFGPSVRQPDGTVRQYGRIPESGRQIRINRYRYGGGTKGNLPINSLEGLTTALAYVSRVTNLNRAIGGRDQESMDELKERARRELRAQLRAVTPEDYEDLAKGATRTVERVKCNVPQNSNGRLSPGVVEILVVPAVADALRAGDLSRLQIDESLANTIRQHLDKYRLLTTILHVREPDYMGVKVDVEVVPSEYVQPEIVKARIIDSLNTFINPLNIAEAPGELDDLMGANWDGWPFGRTLYVPEIFSLLQRIPGVKHVLDVKLSWRPVIPREEIPPTGDEDGVEAKEDLTPVTKKLLKVRSNALLCSLRHEITMVDMNSEEA